MDNWMGHGQILDACSRENFSFQRARDGASLIPPPSRRVIIPRVVLHAAVS